MKRKKFVPYRRKREGKTNYKKRLQMLKSHSVRMVVRKSLKNIIVQLVEYHPDGDKTLVTASSNELAKYGWKHYKRNIPAGYLVGFLCGVKAKQANLNHAVLDIGLYTAKHGTLVFGVLKGAVDAGLDIPHDPAVFPTEDRIAGKHISAELSQAVEAVKTSVQQVK